VQTPFGQIQGKLAVLPDGGTSFSPEFEDCRRIAAEQNQPLKDVYEVAMRAFGQSPAG
jgi:uncharacterized protein (DUF111 family)